MRVCMSVQYNQFHVLSPYCARVSKTLHKMARKREIAGVQIGKLWRFRASVLNEWLEEKVAG